MWVMTPRGFYSVVQHREQPGNVIVRARAWDDLMALLNRHPEWTLQIEETPTADYKYRVHMARVEWEQLVAEMASEIDYDNFKNAVKRENKDRATTYMGVWSRLLSIEREGIEPEEFEPDEDLQLGIDELDPEQVLRHLPEMSNDTHCSGCGRKLRDSGRVRGQTWLNHARDCPRYGREPDAVRGASRNSR